MSIQKTLLFIVIVTCATLFHWSCKHEPTPMMPPKPVVIKPCLNLTEVSYQNQIKPIINDYCIHCHDSTTSLQLHNYYHVNLFARSGQLVGCINGDPNFQQMPPPPVHLDSCSYKTIVYWVQQGELNN